MVKIIDFISREKLEFISFGILRESLKHLILEKVKVFDLSNSNINPLSERLCFLKNIFNIFKTFLLVSLFNLSIRNK
jgi:hypothetical protein